MKKSLRRALWTGAIVAVTTASVPMVQASAAVACASPWSATAVYTNGLTASQNGHNYSAKWWTQNESPATHSGQWDVWSDQGTCSGGGTDPTTPPTNPTT
ncbi:carbohydrate-binding protein, partial [Actinoplanes sp. TFC3]|uniref:carbohydrate-binding protein n=1 Tax=Actinoplanes sp. TFC3 TaxID=1710355 RepID=UPI003516AD4F